VSVLIYRRFLVCWYFNYSVHYSSINVKEQESGAVGQSLGQTSTKHRAR